MLAGLHNKHTDKQTNTLLSFLTAHSTGVGFMFTMWFTTLQRYRAVQCSAVVVCGGKVQTAGVLIPTLQRS